MLVCESERRCEGSLSRRSADCFINLSPSWTVLSLLHSSSEPPPWREWAGWNHQDSQVWAAGWHSGIVGEYIPPRSHIKNPSLFFSSLHAHSWQPRQSFFHSTQRQLLIAIWRIWGLFYDVSVKLALSHIALSPRCVCCNNKPWSPADIAALFSSTPSFQKLRLEISHVTPEIHGSETKEQKWVWAFYHESTWLLLCESAWPLPLYWWQFRFPHRTYRSVR